MECKCTGNDGRAIGKVAGVVFLQTLYSITEQWISSYKKIQGFLQELCVSSQCPYPDSLREDGLVEESTVSFLVACASFVLCVAAHGIIDQRDQEALRRNFGVCKSANGRSGLRFCNSSVASQMTAPKAEEPYRFSLYLTLVYRQPFKRKWRSWRVAYRWR